MTNAPDDSTRDDFKDYYEGVKGRPPRPTLVQAAAAFAAPGFAVDLGCGDGRDTVELLRRGWRVLAIDSSEEGVARLRRRDGMLDNTALKARVARIEDTDWPEADLINASFVLPLLESAGFERAWARIGARLRSGGRFAGQLYGPKDGWAGKPGMTIHDRAAVERLVSGFIVEQLEEKESDEATARGKPKHWHVFHLVLRKP
ncbi:MAG: class I SAM-dependent methyltransferase [Alphaproteobacteria bacterium]|nr:class I SAM-dependent methyltransferase [Alphaproteobacteria bacterium]